MKILLISAVNPHVEIETRYPQLGLGYLVSYARSRLGHNVHEFKVISKKVEETLDTFKPDLVGISCFSPNYNIVKKYARFCRKRRIPVIVGGIHISLLPTSFSEDMNVGVLFEGEETFTELISTYETDGRLDSENISSVKGICYRKNGEIAFSEPRPPIRHMDDIPLPARELLDVKGRHLSMFTSRGCPYRCIFCASSRFWTTTRFASAQYVADEIKELYYNYGAKLISFYDDLFVANKQRIHELIGILTTEGLIGKVRFSCSARANLIDDATARLLKELNVVSVFLGLESGHPRTLAYLKGGSVTLDDNTRSVKVLAQHGITPNATFIIGSPTETKDEIWATYHFIKSVPLSNFNVYVMTPLPGTPIWDESIRRGLVDEGFDSWSILDAVHFKKHHKRAIIVSEELSRDEIYKVYRDFQRLRYMILLKNVYCHPFVRDVPGMLWALGKEKLFRLVGR